MWELVTRHGPALHLALVQLAGVALVIGPFQWLWPAIPRDGRRPSDEFWTDLLYWFQPVVLGMTAYGTAVVVLRSSGTEIVPPLLPWLRAAPFWVQVLAAIWLFDILVYVRHRLEHRIAVLWPIHSIHHTAKRIDFLTTMRLHVVELFAGAVINGIAARRAGLDPMAVAIGLQIYVHYNYFIHANVRLRFPKPLRYVLVSPFMHRWHHATDARAINRNFGVVFAWNDWLFGTAYHPEEEPTEYGLPADAPRARESFFAHVLFPLRWLWGARALPAVAPAGESGITAPPRPDASRT
jgi:sterol desaturase/sphingolipid hydroxylase (fatty acid hydroxylase superfamily)